MAEAAEFKSTPYIAPSPPKTPLSAPNPADKEISTNMRQSLKSSLAIIWSPIEPT